ncbi:hypothetical protein PL11_004715 [Lentilactobacillus curieae]|uniref:D-alanyl-D-alanine carboxypeptidase n=1 Tax=Lentilactobacillus curieae TaxID=1138822 RepID=A0A1S6QI37_9LACO|nr:hypothetical protein [Lentilactobacillus curieae]AQW21274.1 hypothetical protein PL11_004715 [Lentilactobacillus curieae]
MKKQLILFTGLLASLCGLQVTANAASQYSAKRSHEVKLIWRRSMGTHAFKAPTGARFSKHLGVCYGYNPQTADVTWYTDAHEKLYLKNLRMYSIYYHVTSKSGLQGWIWKGYMKPVNSNAGDASSNSSSTGNSANNTTSKPTNSLSQELAGFFENTVPNNQLQQIANQYPSFVSKYSNPDSGDEYFQIMVANNYKATQKYMSFFFIGNSATNGKKEQQQLKSGKVSFKDYVNNAVYAHNGNTSFKTFQNNLIGAYAFPKGSPNYGRGVVVLEDPPKNSTTSTGQG